MILYLDTSALVKLFVVEPGSAAVAAALTLRELVGSAAEVGFGAFDIPLRSAAEVHGLVLCPSA